MALERRPAGRRGPGGAGALLMLVFFYLVALVVQMPMRVLVGLLPLPPEVRLDGVDDSAWAGNIRSVSVAGRDLGSLDYVIHPWRALLGEIEYALALDTGHGRVDTVVNRSPWSPTVKLRNLQGEVDAALFHDVLPATAVTRGRVFVALDSIALQRGDYFHAEGRVEWRDLVVGLGEGVRFGIVDFALQPENAGTRVEIGSRDGEVLAEGTVFIDAEGHADAGIVLREGEDLTAAGRSLLDLAGSVDDGGVLKHASKLF